ncbi:MAG: hypothetical protein BWY09_01424 [Candidatus Hydrogenedentes bacterium ADurb.Bin179]|nr:MAG: hypothetical protein BWY09_01424 [Candidatus Hydrogenedentes bacterium ADurb.Bin179]
MYRDLDATAALIGVGRHQSRGIQRQFLSSGQVIFVAFDQQRQALPALPDGQRPAHGIQREIADVVVRRAVRAFLGPLNELVKQIMPEYRLDPIRGLLPLLAAAIPAPGAIRPLAIGPVDVDGVIVVIELLHDPGDPLVVRPPGIHVSLGEDFLVVPVPDLHLPRGLAGNAFRMVHRPVRHRLPPGFAVRINLKPAFRRVGRGVVYPVFIVEALHLPAGTDDALEPPDLVVGHVRPVIGLHGADVVRVPVGGGPGHALLLDLLQFPDAVRDIGVFSSAPALRKKPFGFYRSKLV